MESLGCTPVEAELFPAKARVSGEMGQLYPTFVGRISKAEVTSHSFYMLLLEAMHVRVSKGTPNLPL